MSLHLFYTTETFHLSYHMKIAIIGGGAAGMMVAATLLKPTTPTGSPSFMPDQVLHREEYQVHLFEKNSRLGAKVIISGGGRCNVTTGFFKTADLLTKYPRGGAFLRPALERF